MSSFSFSVSFLPNHHFKFNAYYLMLMISWRCQLRFRSEFLVTFSALWVVCVYARGKCGWQEVKEFCDFLFRVSKTKINKNLMPRGAERERAMWLLMILICLISRAKNSLLSYRQCHHCLLLWNDFDGKLDFIFKIRNLYQTFI